MSYSRITTANEHDIQKRLDSGWVLIDVSKKVTGYNDDETAVTYHIGYPFAKREQDLLDIIHLYEEHGFKEELFRKLAEKYEDSIHNYNSHETPSDKDLPVLLSKYDSVLGNKDVRYGIRRQPSWSEIPDNY